MLDADDIQIISKIVSDALAEERKQTEAMLGREKKNLRQELRADMMTIIESEVNPKFRLLAEAHETLLEKSAAFRKTRRLTAESPSLRTRSKG